MPKRDAKGHHQVPPYAPRPASRTGGPKAGPAGFTVITKALLIAGYVGPISPASRRAGEPPVYGLTVPFEQALDELSYQFNRKGWGWGWNSNAFGGLIFCLLNRVDLNEPP